MIGLGTELVLTDRHPIEREFAQAIDECERRVWIPKLARLDRDKAAKPVDAPVDRPNRRQNKVDDSVLIRQPVRFGFPA